MQKEVEDAPLNKSCEPAKVTKKRKRIYQTNGSKKCKKKKKKNLQDKHNNSINTQLHPWAQVQHSAAAYKETSEPIHATEPCSVDCHSLHDKTGTMQDLQMLKGQQLQDGHHGDCWAQDGPSSVFYAQRHATADLIQSALPTQDCCLTCWVA